MCKQPKDRLNPTLPRRPTCTPVRVDFFFANVAAHDIFVESTFVRRMLAVTESIFGEYNMHLDVRPTMQPDERQYAARLKARILAWKGGRVRVPRKGPSSADFRTDQGDLSSYAAIMQPAQDRRSRLRVIFCEYDYTDAELAAANRWAQEVSMGRRRKAPALEWRKGDTLGDKTWKGAVEPWVTINLRLPLLYLKDCFTLAHEIVHASGLEHPRRPLPENLMNEGAADGYVLRQDQLEVFARAPFCK